MEQVQKLIVIVMVNYDVAQTAGMAKTRGDQFSHISGVWMINDTQ